MGVAVDGVCHLCKEHTQVVHCAVCGHWFCGPCWSRWYSRGIEAIKQLVTGATEGCCGPTGGG